MLARFRPKKKSRGETVAPQKTFREGLEKSFPAGATSRIRRASEQA
jgi:hypothetical protein